jgi:hypothetical protein
MPLPEHKPDLPDVQFPPRRVPLSPGINTPEGRQSAERFQQLPPAEKMRILYGLPKKWTKESGNPE